MRAEIQLFLLDSLLDRDTVHNVLLRPILDANESESQLHVLAFEHALGIGTLVHNVNLRDNTNRPNSLWIQLSGHLQTVGGRHIGIGWENAKNNSSWITAVPRRHSLRDFLDIRVLTVNWNSRDSRQVNHGEVWTGVRVNVENNWLVDDILFLPANFIRQKVDCLLHLLEVREFLVGHLLEFSPRFDVF